MYKCAKQYYFCCEYLYININTWKGRLDIKLITMVISEEGTKDAGLGRCAKGMTTFSYILFLSPQHLLGLFNK